MESFYKEATKSSPEVNFESKKNKITINGESYPENSYSFYKPIFDLVEKALEIKDKFKLEVKISYLNTSSTKSFMNLLDILEEGYQNGKNVSVDWYYEEDNEHAYELALEFEDYLDLPFNIISSS